VGGYWDKSCNTVTQLKEGLNRILSLIPYNVISQPLWECFMPEWLEAIRTEVPDQQLKEFREVLRYCILNFLQVAQFTVLPTLRQWVPMVTVDADIIFSLMRKFECYVKCNVTM
jgi:hypothetical protein